ncbi:MAG: hypothetical protein RL084_1745, partial [Pseudomonadota bacterium]
LVQPIQTGRAGRQFGRVDVAIHPEGGLVDVCACTFTRDHQDPNGSVFVAAAQFSQLDQVGPGVGEILKQLGEFGVLVKAIEFGLG